MTHEICRRCVLEADTPGIRFDEKGLCNFCSNFLRRQSAHNDNNTNVAAARDRLIDTIKSSGQGKDYDCIVGVSGGVDSSYALYLAVKHGLRPLAVHLDNGWNSELATHNIANLVTNLDVDLHTHVIDWEEYRDIQLSFFKAHVLDIELIMDNAMLALNWHQASKYDLKYILAGTNTATEGMEMPRGWNHFKYDVRNIRNINKKFGTGKIETNPLFSSFDQIYYRYFKRINWVSFLDYFDYRKEEALSILDKECDYRPYPYKHYESIFTRFYQAYILPKKFGIDKRRLHLSNLVVTGQMERDEAIALLQEDPYPDERQLVIDKKFVLKKLGVSEEWFEDYISQPVIPHETYGSERYLYECLQKIYQLTKRN